MLNKLFSLCSQTIFKKVKLFEHFRWARFRGLAPKVCDKGQKNTTSHWEDEGLN
jgi:hypothetical protein